MYGIASTNLIEGSHTIEVMLPETISDISMTAADTNDVSSKFTNVKDREDKKTVFQGITVLAKWIGLNTNRVDAPMIKKGMIVELFKYGKDDYRWAMVGGQFDLMKNDKATYLLRSYEDDNMSDSKNSHVFVVDMLKEKRIYLKTVKTKAGEKIGIELDIDLLKGIIKYNDTNKNIIEMNGDKSKLYLDIQEEIKLRTKNYILECETVVIKAKSSIDITTKEYTLSGGKGTIKSTLTCMANVDFKSTTNFFAPVKMNNNAMITGYSSPISHGGTIA